MRKRLVVVGGGAMGSALLAGLVESGWATPAELAVVEVRDTRRAELTRLHPGVEVSAEPLPAEGVVLAVKPPDVPAAARAAARAGAGRLLSIAAGVPTSVIEEAAPGIPVVRAMPNTPAQVRHGAAAIAPGSSAGPGDLDWAESVLASVGVVVRVPEPLLDPVTGLSGSGPAYVFLVAEALTEAGVANGLPRDVASTLATHTLLGAARLLVDSDEHPAVLRGAVTSPGGTTAAGLAALERAAVRAAFIDAVTAATRRSVELAREDDG